MKVFVIARSRAEFVAEVESIFARVSSVLRYEKLSRTEIKIDTVSFIWVEHAKDLVDQSGHYYLAWCHEQHPEWWSIGEIIKGEGFKQWAPKEKNQN